MKVPLILAIFLSLLGLSVVVMFLGYYTDDEPYLTVGLFFLFLLSTIILTGNLTYQTGQNATTCDYEETFIYGNNYSGYHWDYDFPKPNVTDVNLFHMNRTYNGCVETTTNIYTAWNDNTSTKVGWGLTIASVLGLALSLYTMGRRRIQDG